MSYTTPSNVDGFSRFFAQSFNEKNIIGITTVFLAMFSRRNPVIRTDASVVDIDIIRGNERTAAFIPRGTVGDYLKNKDVDGGKYTNFSRQFPLSEETFSIQAETLGDRMAGENPYSQKTRLMRMRDKAREAYHNMIMRTVRAWEIAAASSALTATQPAILGTTDPNYILDYKRDSSLIVDYAAGARWDVDTNDPIADLDDKITLLVQKGKVGGQSGGKYVCLMGDDTIDGFLGNAKVKEAGNNRRIYTVEKNPELSAPKEIQDLIAGGASYVAKVVSNKGRTIYILTYTSFYDDESGTSTPYMTSDSFLLTPLTFRADRYFGPPDTLPMTSGDMAYLRETFGITPTSQFPSINIKAAAGVVDPSFFYTDAFPGGSRKNAVLRVQSAPIFATTQTDALFTGNTVVG